MVNEQIILQVLAEQREEMLDYKSSGWVDRMEETLFEFDSPLAQVVIGVRRSGKSTLCHKVLRSHRIRYAYVNLDDDRLANMEVQDLNTLLSCIYQLYGTDIPYIFFDEIQNVEGWHLFVNRLLRINIHIFVTGSNAKLLSSELATHLTGRYNEIRLFPFSFAEYCKFHKIDLSGLTTKAEADRKRAFMTYIQDGGFPEIQRLRNKRTYVQSLIEAILTKDIQRRYKIRNVESLRIVANHLINNACQEVKYDKLAQLLGISDKTLKKYVDYLKQAFLLQLLTKHSFKSKERIRCAKVYVVDMGLQDNREDALMAENIGWRLENVVYIELLRRAANYFHDIYFYKPTSQSKEVDFVICERSVVKELIQVAYDIESPKAYERETSALVKAAVSLHCSQLTLIAFTPSRDVEIDGQLIHIRSAIDWLLQS